MSNRVIFIMVILSLFFIFNGCETKEESNFELPEKVIHQLGKIINLTPSAFVDSFNKGEDIRMFFIEQTVAENADHIVQIPGMEYIPFGEMFYMAETLKVDKPLYLISLYGSDARNLARELIKRGHDCFIVVGGSYQLYKTMKQRKLEFLPKPWQNNK